MSYTGSYNCQNSLNYPLKIYAHLYTIVCKLNLIFLKQKQNVTVLII